MMGMPEVASTILCIAMPRKVWFLCHCNAEMAHDLINLQQVPIRTNRPVHISPNTACMLR